jgi:hypothetical protein
LVLWDRVGLDSWAIQLGSAVGFDDVAPRAPDGLFWSPSI